jgi:hypothetical protein
MRTLLACAAAVLACALLRRLARMAAPQDAKIDALIAANKYATRDGMSDMDWAKAARSGQRQWDDVKKAQRRLSRPRARTRSQPAAAPQLPATEQPHDRTRIH